jgi:hypothetical protein
MPLVILACRVLESLMEPYRREAGISALFMEYGLHRTPELMAAALQGAIDRLTEPSVVILGYGLCGNGVVGLQARQHTLIVPRADDCITLLLGSYERYMQEFSAEPGTYYLTKGWLESGSHPLSEYQQLLEKYDQATADWILDEQYRNYRRLVLIASNQAELVACRAQALEIAEFCAARWGFRYEERIGSTDLVKRLVTKAHELQESTDDFLLIPPGGEIKQEMFWRAPGERPAASSGPKHPNL